MNNKKYIIIVVLVIALVVAGIYFLMFRKKNNIVSAPKNTADPVQQAEIKLEIEKKDADTMKSLDVALDGARLADKDLDGLTDEEEKKLGTDLNNPDIDGDGLLDGDEVKFYKTNPLKADTDGDGFKDGYEVRRGYNPNGPGKLKK